MPPQVFSSRYDYLAAKMQPATGTLVTGLVATFVTAALLGVIILSTHAAWWHSVHRRDQQLLIIRDRQDMQGERALTGGWASLELARWHASCMQSPGRTCSPRAPLPSRRCRAHDVLPFARAA